MESSSTPFRLTFNGLQSRLIRTLKSKLDNGEFTERGLARLTGISQPQVHNLLKGARRLNPDSADIFLEALHLSVMDLLTEAEMATRNPTQPRPDAFSFRSGPPSETQLSLLAGAEHCPKKNPARSLASRFGKTNQAS